MLARRLLPVPGIRLDLAAAAVLVAILVGFTTVGAEVRGANLAFAATALLVVCLLLVLNPRVEISLAILMLFLGLFDGYLKLSTGSEVATLARDILLYSITTGALLRLALRRSPIMMPKYTAHIVLLVAIVLAQALNPSTPGIRGALGGVRQHLEFVPLFFLGFVCLRTERRLRAFLILLVGVAAANAAVSLVQFSLTPDQLAGWGPGYEKLILGRGDFEGSARTFSDALGEQRVRPFGLGSDLGAGGIFGWTAIGAALALIVAPAPNRVRVCGALGVLCCVIAVLTSQSRAVLVAAVVVPLVFVMLSVTSRQATRGLVTLLVGGLLVYAAIFTFVSNTSSASLSRYNTLSSSEFQQTVANDRGGSLALAPGYAVRYPLGVGLGRAGPASGFGGAPSGLNAENTPNFLIAEVGVFGFVVFAALWIRIIVSGIRAARRTTDLTVRLYLAALLAPLVGIALSWLGGTPTTSVPSSPYFWFTAGVIAWFASQTNPRSTARGRPVLISPTPGMPRQPAPLATPRRSS